jgi:hypothetical protein
MMAVMNFQGSRGTPTVVVGWVDVHPEVSSKEDQLDRQFYGSEIGLAKTRPRPTAVSRDSTLLARQQPLGRQRGGAAIEALLVMPISSRSPRDRRLLQCNGSCPLVAGCPAQVDGHQLTVMAGNFWLKQMPDLPA